MTGQVHYKAYQVPRAPARSMAAVSIDDICTSYRWLGHAPGEHTELLALHADYRPGREHREWNRAHSAYPRVAYAQSEHDVLGFVRRYHAERMVCFGLNPRPDAFRNEQGYARSAFEHEIAVSQSALFDYDIKDRRITKAQVQALERFLDFSDDYFQDLGLNVPVRGYSGRGFHQLFAYPAIQVAGCPDIALRLRCFAAGFAAAFEDELTMLNAVLDPTTYDLRRVVRIYGTAKPRVGIVSRFSGGERIEDAALARYLRELTLPKPSAMQYGDKVVLNIADTLPASFTALLAENGRLKALWQGEGKAENADTSCSGYDFSLACHLLSAGYRNVDELATVLALRPDGCFQQSGKGEFYIRRTIANALMKR